MRCLLGRHPSAPTPSSTGTFPTPWASSCLTTLLLPIGNEVTSNGIATGRLPVVWLPPSACLPPAYPECMSGWRRALVAAVLSSVVLVAAIMGFVFTLPVVAAVLTRRKGPPPVLITEAHPASGRASSVDGLGGAPLWAAPSRASGGGSLRRLSGRVVITNS